MLGMSVGGPARRLRILLLETLRGSSDEILERLGPFASWRGLEELWRTGWLGEGKSSVRATSADMRHKLREIAAGRRPVAAVTRAGPGDLVFVAGRVLALLTPHEFLVDDDSGATVLVLGSDGYFWGKRPWVELGDAVAVIGFADVQIDPTVSAAGPRQLPTRAVIRSGPLLPVVVRVG